MNSMPILPITIDARIVAHHCEACSARAISVCGTVPTLELDQLARIARPAKVAALTEFITEGEESLDFFTISSGTARLFKLLPDGRRQITGFATKGDFLGLSLAGRFVYSAEAIDQVGFCRYSRGKWRALVALYPQMEQFILDIVMTELVAAQEQMLLLGRKTARERLASFLIAQDPHVKEPKLPQRILLAMTRNDIADYLGLTVETVSRTISQLRQDAMITVNRADRSVVILDGIGLRAMADGRSLN